MLVALLLVGTALGYGAAQLQRPEPQDVGSPNSLKAENDPEVAVDPLPDADLPPLDPVLPLTTATIDNGTLQATLEVPEGWDATLIPDKGTVFALPSHPDGAYSVRVKRLDGILAPYASVLRRKEGLRDDDTITDLEFTSDTTRPTGTLAFTFLKDGYRKLSIVRFASFPDSKYSDVEIAWTGRLMDEAAMRTLMQRMSASVRPVG